MTKKKIAIIKIIAMYVLRCLSIISEISENQYLIL